MIGVNVTFQYSGDFDRNRIIKVADQARAMFMGMPDLRQEGLHIRRGTSARNEFLRLGVQRCCRRILLGSTPRASSQNSTASDPRSILWRSLRSSITRTCLCRFCQRTVDCSESAPSWEPRTSLAGGQAVEGTWHGTGLVRERARERRETESGLDLRSSPAKLRESERATRSELAFSAWEALQGRFSELPKLTTRWVKRGAR